MPTLSARLQSIFSELKDRRVFRVAVGYAVVAWCVVQVAFVAFPALLLPESLPRTVLVLALLGFPVALVLAWAYDITPEGVGRTGAGPAVAPSLEVTHGSLATVQPVLPRTRVAVLPFANISPSADDEYFADGMTEELISRLSRIPGLDVIARTSVMGYKEQRKTVRDIACELAVGSVLEGSVRRAGDRVRITVQLIDSETHGHLWSEDYDRELRDVFAIQTDIANCVAQRLSARLFTTGREPALMAPTMDLAAYDLYLLARYHWNSYTNDGIGTAIRYFQQAIEKDPRFAAAYAGLADAYTFASIGYVAEPPADAAQKSIGYARKSLELVESSPDAHASLGFITFFYDWDWRAGERELERALELNPSHELANRWYAWTRIGVRDLSAAIDAFRRALDLNPRSPVAITEMGWPYSYLGDHARGKEWYEKALELDPNYVLARYGLAWSCSRLGRYDDAIREYHYALALSGGAPFIRAGLASVLARTGRRDEAQAILESLTQVARGGAKIWLWLAVVQEALGQTDAALASLEQAFETHELMAPSAGMEWLPFESLREEARFHALIDGLDLPTATAEF